MTTRQPLHTYRFDLPIRTVSAANAREHHRAKADRVKRERKAARLASPRWPFAPLLEVVLTRVGRGGLDEGDNLPMALKSVRDGLADRLGFSDDSSPLLRWTYRQRREPVDFFVEVEIRIFGPVRLALEVAQPEQQRAASSPPTRTPSTEGALPSGGLARRGRPVSSPPREGPAARSLADLARPAYTGPPRK